MGKFSRDEKFIIGGEVYIFFLLGIYTLMVGVLVPQLRAQYGISYDFSGVLISVNSIGMVAMNLISSYTAILFGLKRAYILQHALIIVGFVLVTVSGNPAFLLVGMACVGFARGSGANYSNQIVNDITKSDSRLMNLMGVFFAAGACVAPFVMMFASDVAGNWRYANYGISVAAAAGLVITYFMRFGKEGIGTGGDKRGNLSFFRKKKYWVTLFSLFCYSGMEISIIGWLVTFFIETQNTTTRFASTMATVMWISILVGRVICSVIANRTTKARFVFGLSIGIAVFMALFVSRINLPLQIAAMVGLGLFMSGTYSTILADAGPIFSEYKLAFGYFFMMAGLGPVIMPSVIGFIAERQGIRVGIRFLAVAAAALLVISFLNVRLDNKNGSQRGAGGRTQDPPLQGNAGKGVLDKNA